MRKDAIVLATTSTGSPRGRVLGIEETEEEDNYERGDEG